MERSGKDGILNGSIIRNLRYGWQFCFWEQEEYFTKIKKNLQ